MGEIIVSKAVQSLPYIFLEAGWLYYVDGEGNVCKAKLMRGGKKKKDEK
jgi:hypothetical protein